MEVSDYRSLLDAIQEAQVERDYYKERIISERMSADALIDSQTNQIQCLTDALNEMISREKTTKVKSIYQDVLYFIGGIGIGSIID